MAIGDRAGATNSDTDPATGRRLLADALPPVPAKTDQPNHESAPKARPERLLPGEPHPQPIPNFPGSYYYKAASSHWHWSGMDATVKLGSPSIDPKRVDAKGRELDGFSIYLGGNANGKHEIDAGLTWDYPTDSKGHIDKSHKEWRPFYRNGSWHWADKEHAFWKPGDTVAISVSMVAPGRMHMHISDAEPDPYRSARHADVDFAAPGFDAKHSVQFKRVNAIDQVATEGKHVHPTRSKIVDTTWLSTHLTHNTPNGKETVPFIGLRKSTLQTPFGHIQIRHSKEQENIGAESVEIRGSLHD